MAASVVWPAGLVLALLSISCLPEEVVALPKSIVTTLDAKWASTPLVLEASEYLAQESNDLFWKFAERTPDISQFNEQEQYSQFFSVLQTVISSEQQLKLLKFSLALRQYSPTVRLHYELARDEIPAGCQAFVDIHGEVTCDSSRMEELLASAALRKAPVTYKFDHQYPSGASKQSSATVILYASIGTQMFHDFHLTLRALATSGSISTYILRHFAADSSSGQPLRLSGYGVEMAIKSTEYKAKDDSKVPGDGHGAEELLEGEVGGFNFTKLRDRYPNLRKELLQFRSHLSPSDHELSPLKVWELQDLSLQAAQKVLTEQSLEVLRDFSQNFPSLAKTLAKTTVDSHVKSEIGQTQKYLEAMHIFPGDSALYINGIQLDLDVTDTFALLDLLRAESKVIDALSSLGLKNDNIQQLLKITAGDPEKSTFALDLRDSAVVFVNDLEHDDAYRHWPRALHSLLQPSFPGMMRHVAKNIMNLVLVVDPANEDCRALIQLAYSFYANQAPVRIGIIPSATSEVGAMLVKFFSYIHDEISANEAFQFLYRFYHSLNGAKVTSDAAIAFFKKRHPRADYMDVLESDDYDAPRKAAIDFHAHSGLPSRVPLALLNGVPLPDAVLTEDGFEEGVVSAVLGATSELQAAVYKGQLNDNMDTFEWIMTRPNVVPRLNARILAGGSKYLDFFDAHSSGTSDIVISEMKYLTKKDDNVARPVTLWVVADLDEPAGRQLYYDAIKHVKTSNSMRLAVVHNGAAKPASGSRPSIARAVNAAMASLSPSEARSFVTKLVKEEYAAALLDGSKELQDLEVNGMDTAVFLKAYEQDDKGGVAARMARQAAYVGAHLSLPAGALALVCNGRIVGPLRKDEVFTVDDVALLTKVTLNSGSEEIFSVLGQASASSGNADGADPSRLSDQVMAISSLLASSLSSTKTRNKPLLPQLTHSVLHSPAPDVDAPAFEVLCILDPLTRAAQKLSDLLVLLQQVINADIKVVMNCREKLSDMPLKNFYRLVVEPEVTFGEDGSLSSGPAAVFDHLPQKSMLTLNMHPPDSWLVESVRTPFDLDNILLNEVKSDILAEYELEHLLVEGHCYDATTGQPPRGLQFTMGNGRVSTDTIVMANLGYFQLKANPGAWLLELREGRSRDIYDIVSHENTDSPPNSTDVIAVINSFNSKILRLRVKKKADKMNEDVLGGDDDKDDPQPSLWNSIASSITGSPTVPVKEEDGDKTLNIFSLASGHLYERFLRIMMLRVVRTTKSKVKFWLLKNYLSPTFKQFVPLMAAEYGFEYELVQYKWPRWLNQQTEKQRVMWGYKILFLDVLFPLDVKKIIFVDADQIVLSDLQELNDLDLEGAPYGYTPFCSSRKEMDGFRFWKSGYWSSHLGGRPYHISALYVVDLKKFRKIAAGDRLRGQYQGLSQDPNSLSNLDQDLPNNMIHQVRIKSLPQEWLWCETWCDDASKVKAKTIDLCNNPLTKEPKLQAAQRIVPEWPNYDNEIKALWERIYGSSSSSTKSSEPGRSISLQSETLHRKDEL